MNQIFWLIFSGNSKIFEWFEILQIILVQIRSESLMTKKEKQISNGIRGELSN